MTHRIWLLLALSLLCISSTSFAETLTDRCSGDVAIAPTYESSVDAPGTLILNRSNVDSGWSLPIKIKTSEGGIITGGGFIRWFCKSTTNNWLDPGTWSLDGLSLGVTKCDNNGQYEDYSGGGVCSGSDYVNFGGINKNEWTAERSRCSNGTNKIRVKLGADRKLNIQCLEPESTTKYYGLTAVGLRSWTNESGKIIGDPSCVSWGTNRTDCFVRGTDNALYHKWSIGGGFSGWEWLGGELASSPECVSWGSDRLDCFAKSPQSELIHIWWDHTQWGPWESLGGKIASKPTCISRGYGKLDCFVLNASSNLLHKYYDYGWSGFNNLGGVLTSVPSCINQPPYNMSCYARGTDNALYGISKSVFTSWSNWTSMGGVLTGAPDCVRTDSSLVQCFVRGTDMALWVRNHFPSGGGVNNWRKLGGYMDYNAPECVARKDNRVICLVKGAGKNVASIESKGDQWFNWKPSNQYIVTRPSCTAVSKDRINCMARGELSQPFSTVGSYIY
ncbi:repeat uncharacterized protein DUF346 [Alteromonadaceae bacterium 2753L.S.0a.02]|nr:repeat uncharacterized protein DUF346 [Alteromonadaceae bacterium 2753L.S.0a.02]